MTSDKSAIDPTVAKLACDIFSCKHLEAAQHAATEVFNNATDEDRKNAIDKSGLERLVRKANRRHPCAGFSLIQLVEWHKSKGPQGDNSKTHTGQDWHNPEPFNGDMETAEILVVSMNPAYNFKDRDDENLPNNLKYPRTPRGKMEPDSPEAHDMTRYFVDRFSNSTYITGGTRSENRKPSAFPKYVHKAVSNVFGDPINKHASAAEISDYLISRHVLTTELFHCKSSTHPKYRTELEESLDKCQSHFQGILEQAKNLKLVILLGPSVIRLIFDVEGTIDEKKTAEGTGEVGLLLRDKGFTIGNNIALLPGHGQAQSGCKGILKERTSGKDKFREYLQGFNHLFQ